MVAAEGRYEDNANQIGFPVGVYAQVAMAARSAWNIGPYCATAVFNSFITLKSKVWYCLTLVSCWSITSTTGKASTSEVSSTLNLIDIETLMMS